MRRSFERYQKRKLISSYFSVILSITLVLFLLGVLGLLILNTKKLTDHFKEQMAITVFLKDNAKEVEISQLQKSIALADYTKSAVFVSQEEAAESFSEQIGEDFVAFIGDNPLQNAIDVYIKADFVLPETLETITEELRAKDVVSEVSYDKPLISLLNDNVQKLSIGILIASGVLTLIAVLLINSSIRLSIYSKRFIIKTMQMVGATKSFIRKPFILTNVKLGIAGAVMAVLILALGIYAIDLRFPELQLDEDPLKLSIIFGGILALGILISLISTFFATQRFLNLRTDELYY